MRERRSKKGKWNREKWNQKNWDRENWNRSERMQLKTLICVLGLLLLVFLLVGSVWKRRNTGGGGDQQVPAPTPMPHVPVVEVLHNVWILDIGEQSLRVYRDGAEEQYEYGTPSTGSQRYQPEVWGGEQIADVELTDGAVTDVRIKSEKIHGVVLSAGQDSVEVSGYGALKLAQDFKGYRIYNTLAMCDRRDLVIGYDFADFVLEDGEICAALMTREETTEDIRVLVKTADFGGLLHQELVLTSDTDFVIRYGDYSDRAEEIHSAGDEVSIRRDSVYFEGGGRVQVEPSVLTGRVVLKNIERSQGTPAYRGKLELAGAEEGFAVINIVALEEYLYSVVPSEMPASYPREALKAQAICARTYAYGHIRNAAYPTYGAHVDDSTSYQVYNNVAEQESTTTAVRETYGKLLYTPEGEPAGAYYYSTSCGAGTVANVWKTEEAGTITYLVAKAVNPVSLGESSDIDAGESADIGIGEGADSDIGAYLQDEEHFAAFIRSVNPEDYEAEESWYRWTYCVRKLDPGRMLEALQKRYRVKPELVLTLQKGEFVSREIEEFTEIRDIYVAARLPGGVADELVIETDTGTYKVISEHNIRCVLCDGETKIKRQDGKEVSMQSLLPSAFFVIETGKEHGNVVGYTLTGGGFGHGVGMSQNAAKHMAKSGLSCEEILTFFYNGCAIRDVYAR